MKVLVAEDDPILRRLLRNYMEKWGEEVVLAANGIEAWDAFQKDPFSLIITDWMMPGMDGLELIRRIRTAPDRGYVYTILLTARSQINDIVEGMEAGADDFVTKPFERDELQVRVRAGERIVRLEQALEDQNRELRKAREELESRVEDRTAELAKSNEALRIEILERKRASEDLVAAQRKVIDAEKEKKRFYGDVIRAVTSDRFHLVDPGAIPEEGVLVETLPLEDNPESYSTARRCVGAVAREAGMAEASVKDLVMAAGEAAMNAVKHVGSGRCAIYRGEDRIAIRVTDQGGGIQSENLPATILQPGFSTRVSFGMGFTLMLELSSRIWLSTGSEGTVIQVMKWIDPNLHPDSPLHEPIRRM